MCKDTQGGLLRLNSECEQHNFNQKYKPFKVNLIVIASKVALLKTTTALLQNRTLCAKLN
jgi:hypothetical protein